MTVFNLDTLEPISEFPITGNAAHGAAVDPKPHHGFGSSKPVVMWDTTTMMPIKTIDVEGNPDGIMFEPMTARVYVFSHVAPFATVVNAAEGTVAGTIDLGGMPGASGLGQQGTSATSTSKTRPMSPSSM